MTVNFTGYSYISLLPYLRPNEIVSVTGSDYALSLRRISLTLNDDFNEKKNEHTKHLFLIVKNYQDLIK